MRRLRRSLVSLSLIGVFFLLIEFHRFGTLVPLDPYWRYQGDMLATNIVNSGRLPSGTNFEEHSILTGWVNSFYDDFGSPVIIAVLSIVTGLDTLTLETLPIYALALVLVQSVLATAVVGDRNMFPVALAAAVLYKFLAPHTFVNAHRGGFAWTILLFLIFTVVLRRRRQSKRESTYILLIFAIALPTASHTLPVAALLFMSVLFILSIILERKIFGLGAAALVAMIIVSYNLFVSTWIGRVVFKFAVATSSVSEPITLSTMISSITRSAAVHESLLPYLTDGAPLIFRLLVIISVALAGLITISVILYRFLKIYKSKSLDTIQLFDIIVLAFGIQAIVYVFIIPFFAPSGGINPPLLGLMFFPVIFAKFAYILSNVTIGLNFRTDLVWVCIILVILLPGAAASFTNPLTIGEVNSFSESEYETLEWANDYNSERIVTDFDTASSYYAIGGRSPTYLPPPGEPAYSSEDTAKQVTQIYYTDPEKACDHGGKYIVTDSMMDVAILHLGSLVTHPNEDIREVTSSSPRMNLVFDSGGGFVSSCKTDHPK